MKLPVRVFVCALPLFLVLMPGATHLSGQEPFTAPAELTAEEKGISVLTATQLFNAAYPDLNTQRLSFQFGSQDGHVFLRAAQPIDLLHPNLEFTQSPVLRLDATLSADRRLLRLSADGSSAEADKNRALRDQINSNPTLTAERLKDLVKSVSGKYGPEQAPDLSRHLNAKRWAAFLGADLGVTATRFQWKQDGLSNAKAKPGWVATVAARTADGQIHRYSVRFEPFAGQLVELTEVQE